MFDGKSRYKHQQTRVVLQSKFYATMAKTTRGHTPEKWLNAATLLTGILGKTTNKRYGDIDHKKKKKQVNELKKTGNISLPISLLIFQRVGLFFHQRTLGFTSVFIFGQSYLGD